MQLNKRTLGSMKEELACEYLQSKGYVILRRNYRCRFGEIDIIAKDISEGEPVLCFIEVKHRNNMTHGLPEEAVDYQKQRHITKTALFYLSTQAKQMDVNCRFDVVALQGRTIKLIKNAFETIMC